MVGSMSDGKVNSGTDFPINGDGSSDLSLLKPIMNIGSIMIKAIIGM
jgi:hypothetical protein|tara:strand:- start:3528 stop:3668 length:141 start_codon:yes stop_codon:yes gene_type:complete